MSDIVHKVKQPNKHNIDQKKNYFHTIKRVDR